mmetsp:Transcript_6817/g.21319  ORF Transcript_6817/g.21319 Transcript_6817/m.21319 type:complete len:230 (-) Transcript_6817:44-733(-)
MVECIEKPTHAMKHLHGFFKDAGAGSVELIVKKRYHNGIYIGKVVGRAGPAYRRLIQWVRTGRGTFLFDSGEKYVGDWENDKMSGNGTHSWPNGARFEGQFCNGLMQAGTYFWPDGRSSKRMGNEGNMPPPLNRIAPAGTGAAKSAKGNIVTPPISQNRPPPAEISGCAATTIGGTPDADAGMSTLAQDPRVQNAAEVASLDSVLSLEYPTQKEKLNLPPKKNDTDTSM